MPTLDESYPEMTAALARRYGYPGAAPGGVEPWPRLLAAALGRTVDRPKADAALVGLRDAGLLDPAALAEADLSEIGDATKQAGAPLPVQAVRTLQRLARWVVDRHHGLAEELEDLSTTQLRDELMGLNGVGPATADAILLLGLRRPAYPVDRATYRILMRHGWLDPGAEYEEARDAVERLDPDDADALARLSSWFDRVGRDACRASVARCDRCPLKPFLPEGGPISPFE